MPSGDALPNPSTDPEHLHTLTELAAALNRLRGVRSYKALLKTEPALRQSTLSDLLRGKSMPGRETMVAFLSACGVENQARKPWLAAWERVRTSYLWKPAGAVRVRDARPRLLGVHASIQVESGVDGMPVYVPRDLDADLRTALTAAANHGGMVLLTGNSSVGKTRSLFEGIRAVVPEWWLIYPSDVAKVRAFAEAPTPRTVVWLDELQRYLGQSGGLAAGTVRDLVTAGMVVVATLWPDEYLTRVSSRIQGQDDLYSGDRDLLGLALVIDVPDTFTPGERRRAEALAGDRRIRLALDASDVGVTQVLAAGPELVRRWENAPLDQCYGKAVITAALDARRVGTYGPVTREFLAAAAPVFLSPRQQAAAQADWFESAIRYATEAVHGATACLIPQPGEMGEVTGWVTADYLHQHARKARRTTTVAELVWQALVAHADPVDTLRLAGNAERRGSEKHAEAFYRLGLDVAGYDVSYGLVELLVRQDRADEAISLLRQRVDAGHLPSTFQLAVLLAERGCAEELRQRADAGDSQAANRLAELLAKLGRVEELRQRADAGDGFAVRQLPDLLVRHGLVEELRRRADAGDLFAAIGFNDLLAEQGRVEELRERADAERLGAAERLAELLAKLGHIDELRQRADAGDRLTAYYLLMLLVKQGQVAELQERADAGDRFAASRLDDFWAEHGPIEQLRQRADAGNRIAAKRLADVLVEQGCIDELRERVDAGEYFATQRLADVLFEQGCAEELRGRAEAGEYFAIHALNGLLAEQGHLEELRERSDAGDLLATEWLLDLLVEQDPPDELEREIVAGTPGALERMAELRRNRNNSHSVPG